MDDLVTIGTFSMLSGLSVVALRHYDDVDVLKPAAVDPHTGYRRYSRDQLERAWMIAELRRIDLPLDEVRSVIDAVPEARRALLQGHRDRLRARGRDVDAMVALTDRLLDEEETGMTMTDDVRLVAVNIGVRSEAELAATDGAPTPSSSTSACGTRANPTSATGRRSASRWRTSTPPANGRGGPEDRSTTRRRRARSSPGTASSRTPSATGS